MHSKQKFSSDDWYEHHLELELISATNDAKIVYRLAIELDRSNADAHNKSGRLLQMGGNTADAERHYREALEATPGNVTVVFNLGTVLEDQSWATAAIEAYTTATALFLSLPTRTTIWCNSTRNVETAPPLYNTSFAIVL